MAEKEELNNKTGKRSYTPIVIVLLLVAVFIPLTVYAVRYVIEIRSKALPTEQPKNVEVTNVFDTSASLSWTTPTTSTQGYVKYGNSQSPDIIAFDKRDSGKAELEETVHYVELIDLTPNTEYKFVIFAGDKEYKDSNGSFYTFKTGLVLETVQTPLPVKGEVESSQEGEVVVFMYAQKGENTSSKLSTLTLNKRYTFDLSNLRLEDLSDSFGDVTDSKLYLVAIGAGGEGGSVTTEVIELNE